MKGTILRKRGVLILDRQKFKAQVEQAAREAKGIFEELHSWPELGNEEFKTVTLIGKKLKELGLGIERPLATAVVVNIKGTGGGTLKKTIAFRADIDALPIAEEAMVSYRSRRAGIMHACGHDAHTAILLGLARVLCGMREALQCDVRLIFQPDEEGNGSAERLVRLGILKGVDRIFGFHVRPELNAGSIGLPYGTVHGESRMCRIEVKGEASHGARPDQGKDAVYGAAEFISICQSIVSRDLGPDKAGLISFGKIEGGTGGNILAGQVHIDGIVRGENAQICDFLCSRMNVIAKGLSQVLELRITPEFEQGCRAVVNDEASVEMVKTAAAGKLIEMKELSLTVDDFSAYLRKVPGAYFFLGSGYEGKNNSGLHTSRFQVNEECLETGIETLAGICTQKL